MALGAGATRQELVLLHPLEEEVGVVGPREADTTMQLDRFLRAETECVIRGGFGSGDIGEYLSRERAARLQSGCQRDDD